MSWFSRRSAEPQSPPDLRAEHVLQTHDATERDLAIEAVERELHLPVHSHALHGAPVRSAEPAVTDKAGERSPRRRRPWVARLIICVIVGLGFGAVIIAMIRVADGPVEANATSIKQPPKSPTPTPEHTNSFSGPSVTFSYAGVFDALSQGNAAAPDNEIYNIGSNSSYHRTINVEVMKATAGGLSENSSYRFRQVAADQYRETKLTLSGEPVMLMVRQDQQEQTLFWLHKGKILTIAVVSTEPKDDVPAMMKTITDSLRWRL